MPIREMLQREPTRQVGFRMQVSLFEALIREASASGETLTTTIHRTIRLGLERSDRGSR